MKRYTYILLLLMTGTLLPVRAGSWKTHFAYNNVTQIAVAEEEVYGISDGSLFSVAKNSEILTTYNRQSGLHGTGITCIHYDKTGKQLLIGYGDGKIDIIGHNGTLYISDLYNKDMTQRKTIYNVTIQGRTAYLSTHYGIQTMDLRERKLKDSYWLRPGGQETPVLDVLIANDSIYAFTADSMYCAAMRDNLADYHFWRREARSTRIAPDADKGKREEDDRSIWYAGYHEGIVRQIKATGEWFTYLPNGPQSNVPYRMTAQGETLWMVQGGRWADKYNRPGIVMRYDGSRWTTIHPKAGNEVLDCMNIAVDPKDPQHFYATTYGTGLIEYRADSMVRQETAGSNNTLASTAVNDPTHYTRLDYAQYDQEGRLWFLNSGKVRQLQCLENDHTWHSTDLTYEGSQLQLATPGGLVIDNQNPHYKWFATARYNTMVGLSDDHGTPFDSSDDRVMTRSSWTDQEGRVFEPGFIYDMRQDSRGRVWIATDKGVAYFGKSDYFESNAIIRPVVTDHNGENPLRELVFKAISESPDGHLWFGTENIGVYELNSDASEIIAHYTTDNTAMPANGVLSIACNREGHVFIGTAEGLVEYDPKGSTDGLVQTGEVQTEEADEGRMQRWRLHFSYTGPNEIAASARRIYAAADGALLSLDRDDHTLHYWNKTDGLNGTSVAHIAYHNAARLLVIAYEDGRIDLLSDDGSVTQMPDLYMKAGSVSVETHCISIGSQYTYIGTSFGILALNTRRGEIADTYYIGDEAAAIDVQQIIEWRDSLYAFSYDKIYAASLKDNLADYTFWKSISIPCEQVQQAAVWKDELYTLQHDSLYRRNGNTWELVREEAYQWMHVNEGRMVLYRDSAGALLLTDEDGIERLSPIAYYCNDGLYTNGEYWLAERGFGLIRLGSIGDDYFHPEGPNSNFGYSMRAAHGNIYAVPGGRWAAQYERPAGVNIYNGESWRKLNEGHITPAGQPALDFCSIAVDPKDEGHFFAASYGTGVFEFRNFEVYKKYTPDNSTLRSVSDKYLDQEGKNFYTRTDGATMDDEGNLWVLNVTSIGYPLHVLTPSGQWTGLKLRSGGVDLELITPSGILIDQRDKNRKWFMNQRFDPCVFLFDDGGTPTNGFDDKCIRRSSFTDQNGNVLSPAFIRCIAQDLTNRIWIGTEKGILLIPTNVDFFSSNACRRIIIPRNDGTGLGDYLLGDEQVNCIAVDGGNRIWIGTANSGLYLIEDDTITVAHFTETNSLLPSNSIQSIAIEPKTGEVFVGTDKGIASYRSDASEAQETMSGAYAYPNPVRPNYSGVISICGLMENTVVNIIDAGGNLVCKTRSNGGTAVWDGRLPDGRRATPGVYTALCNANGGHTVVKILVIR